jgi:hypothetical protein
VRVLPWEDGEEFMRMRLEMYETFRPKSGNEARCVEAIVNHEWGMERCRRVREEYHDRMTAVLHGDPEGVAGQHCEGDPHRWHHKALDCTLEEGRLQRHQEREQRKLTELQRLRRLRLMEAVDEVLPATGPMLPEPAILEPAIPVRAAQAVAGTPASPAAADTATPEATRWADGETGNSSNRIPSPVLTRTARRALARQARREERKRRQHGAAANAQNEGGMPLRAGLDHAPERPSPEALAFAPALRSTYEGAT